VTPQIANAAFDPDESFDPRALRLCRKDRVRDALGEPGMALCVESYVGVPGGGEGVKLEEQVLIADTGAAKLSSYPFEERLL
jgi:hypothetical protein